MNTKTKNHIFISRTIAFFIIVLSPLITLAILAHLKSKKLSHFELACQNLGFINRSHQNTIIEILIKKNLLSESDILDCIMSLSFEKKDAILLHTQKQLAISNICNKLNLSGVNYLRKNLFNCLTPSQSTEALVWCLQKNYKRSIGTERIELSDTTEQEKNFYLNKLESFGMLKEIYPKKDSYDAVWILGASRQGLIRRISNYIKYCDISQNEKKVSILSASDRILSNKLDGLCNDFRLSINQEIIDTYNRHGYSINNTDTREEDGKKYIQYLLNQKNKNTTSESQVSQKHSNKNQPAYKQVYESDMAQDILDQCFSSLYATVEHTTKNNNSIYIRATTRDTIKLVSEKLAHQIFKVKNISSKTVNVLICTDNLFAPRQSLIAQQELINAFEKVKNQSMEKTNVVLEIDVLAPRMNNIYTINSSVALSEFSSLILEKYRSYLITKHQINNLDLELALCRVSYVNQNYSESIKTNTKINTELKKISYLLFTNPFLVLFSCAK